MPSTSAWRDTWTDEQRERYNAMSRIDHRAVGFAAQATYERQNPAKRAAMAAVKNALRAGRLTREPCLFCDGLAVEAHHHSYAREHRLSVTWLCRKHHRRIHRRP